MENRKESKSFHATLDSLESIRDFLTAKGKMAGLDKNKIYKLCLAADEIATNIINYGYAKTDISKKIIDVIIQLDDEGITVTLEDTAVPFNPFDNILPTNDDLTKPLEERPIGGLGLMLAKENVDQYTYQFKDGKNRNIFRVNSRTT
ncbi:MAG: ATP-binding protein [Mariniphaga sp.]|nr:ATP-binding protein [Mariniphaga sp.]